MIRTLQLLPGIVGTSDGGTQLMIRGATPFQHLFRLNGITLYNTHHFFGFASAINEELIEQLDVYKGGFPAKYGGRISGVFDAVGRPGHSERVQASVGLNGLHGGGTLSLPLWGKGALQVGYRRSYTEVLQTDLYKNFLDGSLGRTE